MRISELQYELPPELIAQHPVQRRDESRLLVVDRAGGQRRHEIFRHLPALLPAGSLLVLNDTRVLPARLRMHRPTGGRVGGLFLRELQPGRWKIMLTGSSRLKAGEELVIDGSRWVLKLVERVKAGLWRAEIIPADSAETILAEVGHVPLPPYIRRSDTDETHDHEIRDLQRYQTIYARRPGAVAAPTAGLHLTNEVFDGLHEAGMSVEFVTLHVGIGTFAPIRCNDLADHEMHAEWYDCPTATASAINSARAEGRPVVAVGTTTVRVLETCAGRTEQVTAGTGWTRLFIYPPYNFQVVDKLLTNFHLPGSTLLAMVFALAGRDTILAAYEDAIPNKFRFYSYGDAMLIL